VTLFGFHHSHIVVSETPFLVARIAVALTRSKTIQQ